MSLKRDELANPNSCLNKAADSEPIFVLRANDPCAAKIVRAWADEYSMEKTLSSSDGVLTHAQLTKAQEARGLANEMDAWRRIERTVTIEAPRVVSIEHYPLPPSGKRQDGIFGRCVCGELWPCARAPK